MPYFERTTGSLPIGWLKKKKEELSWQSALKVHVSSRQTQQNNTTVGQYDAILRPVGNVPLISTSDRLSRNKCDQSFDFCTVTQEYTEKASVSRFKWVFFVKTVFAFLQMFVRISYWSQLIWRFAQSWAEQYRMCDQFKTGILSKFKLVYISAVSLITGLDVNVNLLTGVFFCVCARVQHGDGTVRTYHLEYTEGGILDMDDLLTDLVEDRDKVRFKRHCLFWLGGVQMYLRLMYLSSYHHTSLISIPPSIT